MMQNDIITLTDESGAPVRFQLLDVVEYRSGDYAVLFPLEEDADMFTILLAEPDPANPEDYFFSGIDEQETIDAVFAKFRKRHPEIFEE